MKWCFVVLWVLVGFLTSNLNAQKKSKKNKVQSEMLLQEPAKPKLVEIKDSIKTETPTVEGAQIQFEKETHDFGKIIQGDIVRYQFKFKNTGNKDLIITDVKGSCGCTITQFPKHPIKPNQESTIDVSFNSSAKMGPQNKNLVVYTNAEPSLKVLYIKAEVVSPSTPTYLQPQKSN